MAEIALKKRRVAETTETGYVNPNRQVVIGPTGLRGSDNFRWLYTLRCNDCGTGYLTNGSDIHDRKCPACQGGRQGSTAEDAKSANGSADAQWNVADAKARLSEAIERAMAGTPQIITRNGKRVAVLVGFDEWEEKTRRKGTLAEFFMNSPLRGLEIDVERKHGPPRDIDL